ncbi:hypothetical protein [Stenotrophomonas sp. GD03657]|uniref:DUF7941 domain-family protein n=1 Tax=Stenotrophomonas sp. GD03657 TaxID=2975363 RepID=UPI002446C2E5|nr:hypothetical protein [Stenotrophomonas sp. GD03657]MDH2154119.1 hypothetical protein [Stenotrophomonas sp. GD03657]
MIDLSLPPRQVLAALINASNTEKLQVSDVDFGVPTVNSDHSRNTKIIVTAKPESPWDTYQAFYYNRMHIGDDVFTTLNTDFTYVEGMTKADLIAKINERWGINLTDDDYTMSELPSGNGTVTITAKPGSLNYIGAGDVRLIASKIPLDVAFPNNVLDGLTYTPPVAP